MKKIPKISPSHLWSLGLCCAILACAGTSGMQAIASEQRVSVPASGSSAAPPVATHTEILEALKAAKIIYLGETHDRAEDRQAQLEILTALYRDNPNMAIGLEMFQRPFQGVVDDYLAGTITEAQLVEQSQYDRRWGFPWESYAPLLRFAKERRLPVLAMNVPSEVTRQVAREGLESLAPQERRFIPPTSEIRTDNAEYRQLLQSVFEDHASSGQGNSTGFDRFFAAQVLWDETMAEAIAQYHQAYPETRIVAIVGRGHVVYGYGIPSRVARRVGSDIVQRSVILGEIEEETLPQSQPVADYIWQYSQ